MPELRALVQKWNDLDPQHPDRDSLLREIETALVVDYRDILVRQAQPFHLPGVNREDIAQDVLAKFIMGLRSGQNGALHALSAGRELAYLLRAGLRHYIDCYRKGRRCQPADETTLDRVSRPHPGADHSEEELKLGALLVAAIHTLPPLEQRLLMIDLGWDEDFNLTRSDKQGRVQTADVANYLCLSVDECYRLREKTRDRFSSKCELLARNGQFDAAECLRMVADRRPPRDGFNSPFFWNVPAARFALHIVELATVPGSALVPDLLRAVEQCDLLNDPEQARGFLDKLTGHKDLASASREVRTDIWIATAILFDHAAATFERRQDWAAARGLIQEGLAALDQVFPDHHDPAGIEEDFKDRYTRVLLQRGILLRRWHEIANHGLPAWNSEQLRRAAELFYEVNLAASRPDHRISALHQIAVCDLLAGNAEAAIGKLVSCLKRWDVLSHQQPDKAVEYHLRKAYEFRRLGNATAQMMSKASDLRTAESWRDQATENLDAAESISRRFGNLRYVEELQEESRKLAESTAAMLRRFDK